MIDKRGLPYAGPGYDANNVSIPTDPRFIEKSDIFLSAKNLGASNRQSGY
jgi:hypothetical protein